jgi:D-cysteine desulfhydrase
VPQLVHQTAADGRTPRPFPWDHIVCATGSGGTLAGLVLGAKLLGLPVQVWGVNVCDTARYFEDRVLEIAAEFQAHFLRMNAADAPELPHATDAPNAHDPSVLSTPPEALDSPGTGESLLRRDDIRILEGYKGPGYAKATPELLAFIRQVARRDGLFLDPVYTGKAFYGLWREIEAGRFGAGERILFLHTGGIFSLFPWRRDLV